MFFIFVFLRCLVPFFLTLPLFLLVFFHRQVSLAFSAPLGRTSSSLFPVVSFDPFIAPFPFFSARFPPLCLRSSFFFPLTRPLGLCSFPLPASLSFLPVTHDFPSPRGVFPFPVCCLLLSLILLDPGYGFVYPFVPPLGFFSYAMHPHCPLVAADAPRCPFFPSFFVPSWLCSRASFSSQP